MQRGQRRSQSRFQQPGRVGSAVPFRCNLTGPVFLPAGTAPSAANNNAVSSPSFDQKLWYPINAASFALPALSSNGFGNAPPTLYWGPGYENEDVSVYKAFHFKKENEQFLIRADITTPESLQSERSERDHKHQLRNWREHQWFVWPNHESGRRAARDGTFGTV